MIGVVLRAMGGQARVPFSVLWLAVLAHILVATTYAASPDQGQSAFELKCKSCHTIGGGQLVGPDLKGITSKQERNSLVRFIVSPSGSMPNLGISEQEAENIVAYIETQSAGAGGEGGSSAGANTKTSSAPAGDAALGRELFTGSATFDRGGVACVSCHHVSGVGAWGGGSLGKDLTQSYTSFGEEGLRSIIRTTPFPIMREAYANRPMTADEAAHLLAFLQQASIAKGQAQDSNPSSFVLVGLGSLVPFLGIIQLIWRGRLRGIRQPLVKGGSR